MKERKGVNFENVSKEVLNTVFDNEETEKMKHNKRIEREYLGMDDDDTSTIAPEDVEDDQDEIDEWMDEYLNDNDRHGIMRD